MTKFLILLAAIPGLRVLQRILLVGLLVTGLSACVSLTTTALSLGLHEQYVEVDPSRSSAGNTVNLIRDAPLVPCPIEQTCDGVFVRSPAPGDEPATLSSYVVDAGGQIRFLVPLPAVEYKAKIPAANLAQGKCTAPITYRKPYGYVGYPLAVLTVPLDLLKDCILFVGLGLGDLVHGRDQNGRQHFEGLSLLAPRVPAHMIETTCDNRFGQKS